MNFSPPQKPISIRAENVVKHFGKQSALKEVSLHFSHSQMHGVIGPEGAGKTTLMRILLHLLKPQSGTISYFEENHPITFEHIRPLVAYMPQSQSLYSDLSISEHLDFFKDLYGISDDIYKQKREELLHITRLSSFTERPAGKLSGGMYKKLGLICALLRSPRVIILDEPTNGVDPISRREFWELLYRLADEKILIIVSTAYMDEAERCSQVHLLDQGSVIGEGEPRALLKNAGVRSLDEFFLKRSGESLFANSDKGAP